MPTQFSFPYEKDKWLFLETTHKLFQKINDNDTIVHKPHNGSEYDQFSSKKIRRLLIVLKFIPKLERILKILISNISIKRIKAFFEKLYTAHLYASVLKRTITMKQAGGHNYIALEAYLPAVKKGVIGGASNTMWGTLYYELKFYNCVDIKNQNRGGKNKLYGNKNPDKYLDLNLDFFLVPFCNGNMNFDKNLWEIPSKGAQSGDLIEELKLEIELNNKS